MVLLSKVRPRNLVQSSIIILKFCRCKEGRGIGRVDLLRKITMTVFWAEKESGSSDRMIIQIAPNVCSCPRIEGNALFGLR